MDINSVEYAGTVATPTQAPPARLPEIAFSGRSNVGKSSLLNVLMRRTRHKLAKVSATPGKTRALNFYRVNDAFFLVDLPGYGYAKIPQPVQGEWKKLIEGYLSKSPMLRGVVHLVDARHAPTDLDREMMDYLSGIEVPALVVATKMDKLKKGERSANLARIQAALGIESEQIVPFSSQTEEGRDELLEALDELLAEPVEVIEHARAATFLTIALLATACAAAPGVVVGRPPAGAARTDELLVPSGYGSLLQDEITLTLAADSVVLKVTPLEEWVLRLTAPDTWSRLSSLAAAQHAEVTRQTGEDEAALFLVSFFSRSPGAAFHPQDVELENRGRRQRPVLIRPLTAGWGSERLQPEVTQSAVYAFPAEVDLEQSLVVDYGTELGTGWDEILRRLEAERGRARARAGLGR